MPAETTEFLVECSMCEKRLQTNNRDAAALFVREHESFSGHDVEWVRGTSD